jgi:hypothetical protein
LAGDGLEALWLAAPEEQRNSVVEAGGTPAPMEARESYNTLGLPALVTPASPSEILRRYTEDMKEVDVVPMNATSPR